MDGNEETTVTDSTVETTETADQTEYTYTQQQIDQERANARKAREELTSLTELYETTNERAETLEKELAEMRQSQEREKSQLEAERQAEQDKLDDMDPDLVDPKVINNIRAIEKRLEKQRNDFQQEKSELLGKITELSQKASEYENERAELQQKQQHDKTVESVLNRVEASLKRQKVTTPGQYRTEAIKLADDLVDKGEVKKPNDVVAAIDLMEDCYLKVISKHQKKKGVSVDGGTSGASPASGKKEKKTGSLDDVAADMLKDKSWKD